ncbi:MAG: DUF58 domain-containing protein [Phycisphaerales bacterium]|nr:DUF58 domain-containing protein [Phycisphaerales bacterium]
MARSARRPPIAEPDPARVPLRVVRRRYHLHVPGVVYVLTTFLMSIGAINSQNNLLFWAFGLAVTALIVSGILSGSALMGLELSRDAIAEAAVGEPLIVRYHLRNRNRFIPAFGLTILEIDRAPRRARKPTWPAHTAPPRAFIAELGAGRTISVEALAPATRRGAATFSQVIVSTTFPFGLTRKSITFAGPASAIIRPARLNLREGLISTLVRKGQEVGATRAVSPLGDEFFTLREYRPGDNTRAVAWRATARAGEWRIRAHSVPGPRRLWIGIDALAPDGDRAEAAISLAAALAVAAHRDGYLIGIWFPSADLLIPPRQSSSTVRTILNALALAQLGDRPSQPPALPASPDRESIVIVHADDARAAAGAPGIAHLTLAALATYLAPGAVPAALPAKEAAA